MPRNWRCRRVARCQRRPVAKGRGARRQAEAHCWWRSGERAPGACPGAACRHRRRHQSLRKLRRKRRGLRGTGCRRRRRRRSKPRAAHRMPRRRRSSPQTPTRPQSQGRGPARRALAASSSSRRRQRRKPTAATPPPRRRADQEPARPRDARRCRGQPRGRWQRAEWLRGAHLWRWRQRG
jgi:hypothetical protein